MPEKFFHFSSPSILTEVREREYINFFLTSIAIVTLEMHCNFLIRMKVMPFILFEILRMICLVKNMLLSSALKIPLILRT